MLVGGYHLILDLEGCNPHLLDSEDAMRRLCLEIARMMGAHVIKSSSHKFKPKGVTAFTIIGESHISIHTWPEARKAFLDIFTCKEFFNTDRILDNIISFLGGIRGRATLLLRNSLLSRLILNGRISNLTRKFDFGHTIFSIGSPLQLIELTKGPMGLSLFLDGYWQFVEKYEHIYHEMLVHPAMVCAARLRRVGIAGGGDGLALREVLKYPQLGKAVLCEIDVLMLAVADQHPEMLRLTKDALRHKKAQVVSDDARKMLVPGANFDVLILDFPSISDGSKFSNLYSEPFYRRAKAALSPGGILVTQVTDFLWNLARTTRNLMKHFPHVIPVDVGLNFSMFNFVLAGISQFKQQRNLPQNLKFVTQEKVRKLITPFKIEKANNCKLNRKSTGSMCV